MSFLNRWFKTHIYALSGRERDFRREDDLRGMALELLKKLNDLEK